MSTPAGASISPPGLESGPVRCGVPSSRRRGSVTFFGFCLWLLTLGLGTAQETARTDQASVLVVVGAAGEEAYGEQFRSWAEQWRKHTEAGGNSWNEIGLTEGDEVTDKDQLRVALESELKKGTAPLWIVLLGHGTFDGKTPKFNLRGPDVSVAEWTEWLQPFQRPVAFINCASSSGPFLNALAGTNRVIVTATRSGYEQNFTRFGQYLAQIIADPQADLDKDGQTSLLEAYLMASRLVDDFYVTEGRLTTEHALLDDTGDGQGTPANWFRGVRVIKKSKDGTPPDGFRAHQFHLVPSALERALPAEVREKRDQLELAIFQIRENKETLEEAAYYTQLESMFLELAKLYEQAEPDPKTAVQ